MADTAIAGHAGGDAFIGALAVGATIFNCVYWSCGFLRMGTSGLTAQAFGARDADEQVRILVRALSIAALLSVILLLIRIPLTRFAVDIIGGSPMVKELASQYVAIRMFAAPASIAMFALHGWFIGMQDSRTPMVIAICTNIINIAVSYWLTFCCDMGIRGIALGTVVAQWSALLMTLLVYLHRYGRLRIPHGCFATRAIIAFLRINGDVFLRTLCVVCAYTMFTKVSTEGGEAALATNALVMQLFTLYSYLQDGLAYAAEALTGRFIGERNIAQLRLIIKRLLISSIAVAIAYDIVLCAAWQPVIALFDPSADVAARLADNAWLIMIMPLVSFLAFILDGVMIGATRTRAMRNSVAMALAAFLVALYPARSAHGSTGIIAAFLLFLLLRGVLLLPQLRKLTKND